MTATSNDEHRVTELLYLERVDHSELLSILLSVFKRTSWVSQSVQRYGESSSGSHVDVLFDSEGSIERITPTLPDHELRTLSDQIKQVLVDNQKEAVAQTFCFSRNRAVRGFYRYKDAFQILPIPAAAPHAPFVVADHPLVLQFSYIISADLGINSKRFKEKTTKLTRILSVVCRPAIFPRSRYTRFFWNTSFDDDECTVKWLQEGYGYPGFTPAPTGFSTVSEFPQITLFPKNEYYSDAFVEPDYELVLPDLIDEYLDKVFALRGEDAKRFAIASTWFSQVSALWMESNSSAFVAAVSAIEALIDKKSEPCEACGQPKFGVTKKFAGFLEEYVPNIRTRFPQELKQIYRVRSSLAHGADLLLADLESWNFLWEPKQAWQNVVERNTHEIVACALLNWVLRH